MTTFTVIALDAHTFFLFSCLILRFRLIQFDSSPAVCKSAILGMDYASVSSQWPEKWSNLRKARFNQRLCMKRERQRQRELI